MKTHETRRPVKIAVIGRKASLPFRTATPQEDRIVARVIREPNRKKRGQIPFKAAIAA
jgi:hypothetical protein